MAICNSSQNPSILPNSILQSTKDFLLPHSVCVCVCVCVLLCIPIGIRRTQDQVSRSLEVDDETKEAFGSTRELMSDTAATPEESLE